MYILSFVAVILITIATVALTGGGFGSIILILDVPSLLLLLILTIPVLLSSGLLKDFNNSFRMVMGNKKITSIVEIKRSIEAVTLVKNILIYGAVFISIFSTIMILKQLDNPESLGPNLAVILITLLYALAVNIVLLPLKSRLQIMLMEHIQD